MCKFKYIRKYILLNFICFVFLCARFIDPLILIDLLDITSEVPQKSCLGPLQLLRKTILKKTSAEVSIFKLNTNNKNSFHTSSL